jgi:hypothetical protein
MVYRSISHTAADFFPLNSSLLLYCSSLTASVGMSSTTAAEAEALSRGSKISPGCPMLRKIVARMIILLREEVSLSVDPVNPSIFLAKLTRSPAQ